MSTKTVEELVFEIGNVFERSKCHTNGARADLMIVWAAVWCVTV